MDYNNMNALARYVVYKYLKNKPELEHLREDLEQDACLKILEAEPLYDSTKGIDRHLWLFFQAQDYVKNVVNRGERRHFTKPVEVEGPYWDLSVTPALAVPEVDHGRELRDALYGIEFTTRQGQVLKRVLKAMTFKAIGEDLGISRSRAQEIYHDIIRKAQKANGL